MAMIWSHFSAREILDRRDELDAGVVDQDVDRAELFGCASSIIAAIFVGLGHVGAVVERLDAEFASRCRRARSRWPRVAEAVDHDVGAFLGEGAGDGEADAAGGAGDDGVMVWRATCGDPPREMPSGAGRLTDAACVNRSYCIAMKHCEWAKRRGMTFPPARPTYPRYRAARAILPPEEWLDELFMPRAGVRPQRAPRDRRGQSRRGTRRPSWSAAARPIVVQSMTNTDTADVDATARQVAALARAGSELVRITVDRDEAAAAVPHIRDGSRRMGVDVPLIGDFHYIGHKLLADHPACAEALAKYRINPGQRRLQGRSETCNSARSSRSRSATARRCGSGPTGARSTRSC